MDYLVRAIKNLCPSAEFSFQNEDYSTIKWDILDGNAPTQSEINAEIQKIKTTDAQEASNKDTKKVALLDRLGITADEAALLLG
jgi:hypothetical protein